MIIDNNVTDFIFVLEILFQRDLTESLVTFKYLIN